MDALNKLIEKIENIELRKYYTGEYENHTISKRDIIRKYNDDFIKIYPNTYLQFIRKMISSRYYDLKRFLQESLLFENGYYNYKDLETIKTREKYIDKFSSNFVSGNFYVKGIEEGYISLDQIKKFINDNPKYSRTLSPLLTQFGKEEDFIELNKMIQNAKLEDSIRISVFNNALVNCKNKDCVNFFINEIKENNYYRLKALKEACYLGYDDSSFDIKKNIQIIEDANNFNYKPYLNKGFRENFYFIKRLQIYSKENFDLYMKVALTGSNKMAKRASLYALYYGYPDMLEDYLDVVFKVNLDYEDLAFMSTFSEYLITKETAILGFNKLYQMFMNMTKVNYHFNKTDDVFVATDISKAKLVEMLVALALKIDNDETYKLMDDATSNMDQESLVKFLEGLSDRTKLNKKEIYLTFLKSDNYIATTFFNKKNIELTFEDAVIVSDYLKSKKETVKKNILKNFLASKDKNEIAKYLIESNVDYKVSIGNEMLEKLGIINNDDIVVKEISKPEQFISEALNFRYKNIKINNISFKKIKKFYEKVEKFINDNKDYEYRPGYFPDSLVTLGTEFNQIVNKRNEDITLLDFPLGDLILKEFKNVLTDDELISFAIKIIYSRINDTRLDKLYFKLLSIDKDEITFLKSLYNSYYYLVVKKIIYFLIKDYVDKKIILNCFIQIINHDQSLLIFNDRHDYDIINVASIIELCKADTSKECLNLWRYFLSLGIKYDKIMIPNNILYILVENDLINYEVLRYILTKASNKMWAITSSRTTVYIQHPNNINSKYSANMIKLIDEAVECELRRGTADTPYTNYIRSCNEYYGVRNYIKAIKAIRNLTLVRGSYFWGTEKNTMISQILRRTIKLSSDTYEDFVRLIKLYNITKEELIRACLYNTSFIDYIDKYLEIPNFKLGVYYFVAHLNESLNEEKIEMFKKYSLIDYNDFKDGAFDIVWYEEMVKTVPKNDLKIIYDNAKYLTVAGLHKRAQRFFDARNNKITLKECVDKIKETRNKDYVLIYSLIPLKSKDDLYDRFIFIQEYLKESKKFGSQRQLSERKVVDIALDNLARLAGYTDTNIFIYEMEATKQIDIYRELIIDDLSIKPVIKHLKISLEVLKNGKKINSIPSKYSKYEDIIKLKEIVKEGENKLKRIVKSFEESMCNQVKFDYEKLMLINNDFIINNVLSKLILLTDDNIPVKINTKELVDLEGNIIKPNYVTIAHPIILKKINKLNEVISFIIKNNIKQPFKQILREFYTKSDLEMTQEDCWRFRGFNVDIKKCIAALKSKGWGMGEDVGLRKVYYYKDIVAIIFREFDYFYTYDFEDVNRELHTITFVNRKTDEIIPLKDIDDITFSECLRDVDLMISISSNSIYDFELAMSTTEIRQEVLKSLIQIIGLTNISFLKDNIKVQGTYGSYLINIRTGLVFMDGKGNLLIKTIYSNEVPILLDFVDEDPMTADIISKAIYLANDEKIKDPSILNQIK